MATGPSSDNQGSPTRPYLLRALHDWCTDNGFTPYIAVHVDASVQVPAEYVKNNEIVLNVGFEATSGLKLGNDFIEFKARFGGVPREIVVPVDHVVAIYARENGQGMAFPMPAGPEAASATPAGAPTQTGATPKGRAPAPARGLRLARQATESVDTVPGDKLPGRPAPGEPEPPAEPPTPPEPGTPRPSLKRIK
ncbi:MAG: ClpXP protease specificity-enhancing factor [Rubrivivax sp.]|nr:ClpXP protease specificity-enhancing factor [Rubrivivax sp.]